MSLHNHGINSLPLDYIRQFYRKIQTVQFSLYTLGNDTNTVWKGGWGWGGAKQQTNKQIKNKTKQTTRTHTRTHAHAHTHAHTHTHIHTPELIYLSFHRFCLHTNTQANNVLGTDYCSRTLYLITLKQALSCCQMVVLISVVSFASVRALSCVTKHLPGPIVTKNCREQPGSG